tara:strand:- start:3121 stop:4200 length:1080 start_codon:yes stop_codon:yes gene_type:complete
VLNALPPEGTRAHPPKGNDKGLKLSLALLVFVAVVAVIWVLFFADGTTPLQQLAKETAATREFVTEEVIPEVPGAQEVTVILPSFDVVRVSRNGTGVIAGRAAPNSDVFVYAWEKLIGQAVADRNGEWVLLFEEPLPSGPTELSLRSQLSGHDVVLSKDIVVVAVPARDEERFVNDETEGVVALLTPRSGKGPSRLLQKPKFAEIGDLTGGLALETLEYDQDGNAIASGKALAGSTIRIYLDNDYLGETVSNDKGYWSLPLGVAITKGEHVIRLDQLIDNDDVQLRIEQRFNRGEVIDPSQVEGHIVVNPGNSLWQIARKLYGSGFHYTLIFGANREAIRDPDLIFPGQKFALPRKPEL